MLHYSIILCFMASHKIALIGSCFTENIAEKFAKHKFTILENANGIVFNPVSVAETIMNAINNKHYTATDTFKLSNLFAIGI